MVRLPPHKGPESGGTTLINASNILFSYRYRRCYAVLLLLAFHTGLQGRFQTFLLRILQLPYGDSLSGRLLFCTNPLPRRVSLFCPFVSVDLYHDCRQKFEVCQPSWPNVVLFFKRFSPIAMTRNVKGRFSTCAKLTILWIR